LGGGNPRVIVDREERGKEKNVVRWSETCGGGGGGRWILSLRGGRKNQSRSMLGGGEGDSTFPAVPGSEEKRKIRKFDSHSHEPLRGLLSLRKKTRNSVSAMEGGPTAVSRTLGREDGSYSRKNK